MNENDAWYFIFMLFMLEGENVTSLISSDAFNSDFDNLIHKYEIMDSDEFKQKSINALKDKKDIFQNLNTAYKKEQEK